ncbi:MAG TPA: hypothetical protein DHU96_07415 [Actinobacteria bacterium]|nr:hypothetical protein [Actinomycetota bacterium]
MVGGGSRRMLLITLAVCLCMAAAGVSVAVSSSPSGSQAGHIAGAGTGPTATRTGATEPTAPVASSRVTTKPGVTSDGISTSVLRWPPQLKSQILRWKAGHGGAALATVVQQMGNAMQAAGVKLYAPMRLTCVSLASDISTAQAGPPIPDDGMQRLYAKALAGLSRAAADCRTAISVHVSGNESVETHVNEALLNRSRVEFAAMSKTLYRATGEIQSLRR